MVLAEVSPSGDGGVAAGAETEVARIFEILEAKRGGKSLVTAFGDEQLAVVAEAMVGDATSAAHLQENMLGDASIVDVFSPYFARAVGRDTLPPHLQATLRAWWLGAAQAGGTLQVARSASAPPVRVASAPAAAEESALTEVQVAELTKQNLSSAGALALSVSLLTGYVVTDKDLASGGSVFEGAIYGRNPSTVKCVRQAKDDPGSLHHALKSGERSVFFTYIERFFRKYPGRGLPELPLDRILRDDVYREHERSVESFKKELAELAKRVTKAEAAAAEAQRAAEEAKRSGKSGAKTCFWCGEDVTVPNTDLATFTALVRYLFTDQLDLGEEEGGRAQRALDLRQLAQMYQVPRLELLCAQALLESVGPASAVPLLEAAHATGDGWLLAQCRRYVADNAAEVRASGGVEQLRDLGVAKGLLGDALDQVAELKGTVAARDVELEKVRA
ncbi:hypothetical protein EMIHUDRAFT_116656 [Emiliania huxleyi CCMP1516]|uniref:BTB domain-containing protein n=2 Tax=Emiliania huxleyi TaxID=2903 RepID=A0A0D3JGC6_EMIH1|nr:hypothetical protein EMIHUDRAFT_116656 [Emiliania huxleyi CCMP1516]EOD22561.1 hypothetical protein EMIHUDRAFT_116656 [Emiliania huxleyi CCMP1516]|eukprot:XP_005774990.1 hypothetical protein EMIHUDRAFT_116656 [Emiliania huxleyi CCMP1516]